MTPAVGEMYTVVPHMLPHGDRCGTFHCRVTSGPRDGKAIVQQMKIDGQRWKPSMSTCVFITALRPLEVQVDLFGDPSPVRGTDA
ncbi:MAG: hypothetical protein JWO11_4479 [Nocardioides sp.]|nr:hypothetical protein [Nocardioides sp.]